MLADPIDTIETDRLWAWPGRHSPLFAVCGHCMEPDRLCEFDSGTLSDRADRRCPLAEFAGGGVVVRLAVALARPCSGAANLCVSPCGRCCCDCCCLCWFGSAATFLKVMVHLTSSPAKTVCSRQLMKTRMLLTASGDMLDEEAPRRGQRRAGVQVSADVSYPSPELAREAMVMAVDGQCELQMRWGSSGQRHDNVEGTRTGGPR